MDKCSIELASECAQRLLNSWQKPVGLDDAMWTRNAGVLFLKYSPEAVRMATDKAIEKFKRLPSPAHLKELLDNEEHHQSYMADVKAHERVIIPIDQQSDEEIVDQLVRRAMRNDAWPIVESERGKRLAQRAVGAFLREMDAGRDHHRMGFYMLRNRGFIPATATLDDVPIRPKDDRTEFLNATLKKYGFGPVGSVLRKM